MCGQAITHSTLQNLGAWYSWKGEQRNYDVYIHKQNLLCISSFRALFSIRRHWASTMAWWIALKGGAVPTTWMSFSVIPESQPFANSFGVNKMSEASRFSCWLRYESLSLSCVGGPQLWERQLPSRFDELVFAISTLCAFGSTYTTEWVKLKKKRGKKHLDTLKLNIYLVYSAETKSSSNR